MAAGVETQQRPAGQSYSGKTGAAAAGVHHLLGADQDPKFHDNPTVSPEETQQTVREVRQGGHVGVGQGPQIKSTSNTTEVLCGPLLNYRRMSKAATDSPVWHGSVLLVTTPGQQPPRLRLRVLRSSDQDVVLTGTASYTSSVTAEALYHDPNSTFWRFTIEAPFQTQETKWQYSIDGLTAVRESKFPPSAPRTFVVPAKDQSMRIMFHSCNGFSAGTDEEAWSGPALWNDVLRVHAQKPFHVMIGGGDQIYNDGVRVTGPLKPWTDLANPHKRREFPFNEELRAQCDQWYFDNYVRWYSTEPFSTANGQIPQLNIWDDHDIIDGFGSYTEHFMRSHVFRGIGGVAHKYYFLFQHHIPPPKSTYTSDAPATHSADHNGTTPADAVQLKDTWVNLDQHEDPSFIIGKTPGPYVEERSRSIYCQLGARIAFVGIDARTERTRHQINYPDTYDQIFDRADKELSAMNGKIKHLVLLLGVPIAYPRLQWLENVFQSPIIGPIRFLNKRFGFAGGFFNHFDGQVEILDDLDDHYTAHQHKKERKYLILRLQEFARKHSVRVTILGGDVHLGAVGRFYSNPKENLKSEHDWRYMPNIVSSAITNKPPPTAVANLLARRNKIHHLDHITDETMLNFFDKDPGAGQADVKSKTENKNHCTMPSRNYAILSESHDNRSFHDTSVNGLTNGDVSNGQTNEYTNGHTEGLTNGHTSGVTNGDTSNLTNGTTSNGTHNPTGNSATAANFTPHKNPREALHHGEHEAGTTHPASSGVTATGLGGQYGLDVTLKVEISPSDREGKTQGYGFTIPGLDCAAYAGQGRTW